LNFMHSVFKFEDTNEVIIVDKTAEHASITLHSPPVGQFLEKSDEWGVH
jgi:hypothetical protein